MAAHFLLRTPPPMATILVLVYFAFCYFFCKFLVFQVVVILVVSLHLSLVAITFFVHYLHRHYF